MVAELDRLRRENEGLQENIENLNRDFYRLSIHGRDEAIMMETLKYATKEKDDQ
jgi:hypothetical protein